MPEPAKSERLGLLRTVGTILISIVGGFLVGFVVQSTLTPWKPRNHPAIWVAFALALFLPVYFAIRASWFKRTVPPGQRDQLLDPLVETLGDLMFALFMASGDFVWSSTHELMAPFGAKWFVIYFLGLFAATTLFRWLLKPSKWEREA